MKHSGSNLWIYCAAYEILGNPTKRRSYDSIDPEFDDSVPSNNADSKQNFFKVFGPVFERNARLDALWIKILKIPENGQCV